MRKNLPVTEVERTFEDHERIISTTDLKGRITSFNDHFLNISGFEADELMGKPHNIIRHPDMPEAAFKDLWDTLAAGKAWMGLVKNRCKNGDYYWVNAYVTPVYEGTELVGYQSVRVRPERQYVKQAEKLYRRINQGKSVSSSLQSLQKLGVVAILAALPAVSVFAASVATMATPMVLVAAGVSTAVSAALIHNWYQKSWQRVGVLAKRAYGSDLSCLAYCGEVTPATQVEVALVSESSKQVTLLELIESSSQSLLGQVQNINSAVSQTATGVEQQNSDISQLATAVNQMNAANKEVAQSCSQAADNTRDASSQTNQNAEILGCASTSISGLSGDVETASDLVFKLKQDTLSITEIVGVINGIAEQTNLLALNAAIEAARAGESGRGFAVVADEVRTLASRTQESTTSIEAMISALQSRVDEVVTVMESGQGSANKVVEQITEVNDKLGEVIHAVNQANDMTVHIATATEEQSSVTEEINRNVSNIYEETDRLSSSADQAAGASKELERLAVSLNAVVGHFKDH